MIATLRGIITHKSPPCLTIEVNGVGYEVQAPMTTFYHLEQIPAEVMLYTHLAIREDAHQLYGFHLAKDRDLFRTLIKVNGVGPKLGLSILSGIEPQQFIHAVTNQDASSLVKIPGVGKKTAERLIIECRDVLKKWLSQDPSHQNMTVGSQHKQDAIEALAALGYKPNDAKRAVDKVYQAELAAEQIIRQALQLMVTGA